MAAPPTRRKGGTNPFTLSLDPGDRLFASGEGRPGAAGGGEPPPERKPKPAKDGGKKPPKKNKAAGERRWLRRTLVWGATLAIWAGIALAGVVAYYAIDLPDIDRMTATTRRPSVVFQSVDGEVFAAYGDLYGEPLDLAIGQKVRFKGYLGIYHEKLTFAVSHKL